MAGYQTLVRESIKVFFGRTVNFQEINLKNSLDVSHTTVKVPATCLINYGLKTEEASKLMQMIYDLKNLNF